ncbi:F-actin-monooxygenase Mical isoform X4 [Condylostylus longicornis]|uniref:F-actin-monooxygenase Mical isoform X4 n=1 Tax=Condylostylus longicornis TaxID=2530218 RepID=UPI00244DA170|nr:F-actin-monooxygenase Mical isoform X4 [Condylostylus longicornis]
MSKSTHHIKQQQQMMLDETASMVAEMFDLFCGATTMRQILGLYRNICDSLNLRPGPLNDFYPKLKSKIRSWKAQALWKKFDTRAQHRVYCKGTACNGSRVLVIGAGPCGLRTAIEAQLMGAKVVVVEKRDRISRNNVVHLWPFVITDLRNLGAKKFYGKFCAGSIDHISIRQLQCILLKVALLLGVEIHEGVSFINIIEPSDGLGWRADVSPEDHAVSHYEFDVLIGADGKRNTLEGFKRKEFRGKLAIAITANFINKKTEAEARAEEISGVAFIFNQSFFKELYQTTGIDLENIVYYKDETHYFVMTAKKHSLIDKGVIMQDYIDPAELLASSNVNTERLLDYAREAAEFSTKYQMPNLEFAVNHYGKPDVAMFDFTSMFAAEASSRVIVRKNYRLLQCLVGDSLLEPFWPTGSGCARGFLSSMDAAYMVKLWANPRNSILGVLAQRESIYRLLAQTTPENLQRDIGAYTVDPTSRYPNLNKSIVTVCQVKHLIDTDDKNLLEQSHMDVNAFVPAETPMRRKRRTGDTLPLSAVILRWIKAQLHAHDFMQNITEVSECFTNGKILCALINRYRPDLIDLNSIKDLTAIESNELAFKILETDLSIPRVMSSKDSINLENIDSKIWLNYLEQICEVFRGEIPHVKHPKLDVFELRDKSAKDKQQAADFSRLLNRNTKKAKSPMQEIDLTAGVHRRSILDEEKIRRQRKYGSDSPGQMDTSRRAKKRRSQEKSANIEERQERLKDIEANRLERQSKRKQQRYQQNLNFYKSLHMLQAGQLLREGLEQRPFEDYSIYMYRQNAPEFNERVKELEKKLLYPDRERGIQSSFPRGGNDINFSDRIKSMEQQITSKGSGVTEKKPKDLLRAIGKIDSSDWQIREIEKKMQQSKKTETTGKSREKVPKWSKEQFLDRQNKMSKPPNEGEEETDEKFKEIDETLKNLDKQLKDGSLLEIGQRGKNKVASIAGQFGKKEDSSDEKQSQPVAKSNSKVALVFSKQTTSEKCHFCKQTVYLMEKVTTEGLTLHRSCLKCHHCHTNLRLGAYAFDRDDPDGRFYCTQHFKLPAKAVRPVVKKSKPKKPLADTTNIDKDDLRRGRPEAVAQLDLLDRGQTPERIEFENADAMSDGEPSLGNIMDENEWTDRNFVSDSDESESDLSSSDESDEESESFDDPDEGSPIAQTLQLATDWIGKQRYNNESDDSDIDFYDSSEGMLDDDDADSQTEGEEFKKAREMRRQEVKLLPLPPNLPTDTETEVQSETESSSSDDNVLNSATEISTDSEFDHDPVIRETPKIFIDDTHLRKPTKVQIKSIVIDNGMPGSQPKLRTVTNTHATTTALQTALSHQKLEFKPLVQVDPSLLNSNRVPLKNPRPGDYLLNKTASTEGIASKKSLELKKRYLLGGEDILGNKIMKSGSTSVLDSKLKNFHSNISECQKLLNPAAEISPGMKTFLDRTKLVNSNEKLGNILQSDIVNKSNTKSDLTSKSEQKLPESNLPQNDFVMNQNEINKMETTKKQHEFKTNTPVKIPSPIIETIDLISPEKTVPIIDLNESNIPSALNVSSPEIFNARNSLDGQKLLLTTIEVIDLTKASSDENEPCSIIRNTPLPSSNETKNVIPDILTHTEKYKTDSERSANTEENKIVTTNVSKREETNDDCQETSIEVPSIPWAKKSDKDEECDNVETDSLTSESSSTSSLNDIPHYILDSTTSPDTQNGFNLFSNSSAAEPIVPRLEIHDSSGTLMQIDSLMIIDGQYIGDPEDLKLMEIPEGMTTSTSTITADTIIENSSSSQSKSSEKDDVENKTAHKDSSEINETFLTKDATNPKAVKPEKKIELKFDTKNENKVESLKNLPLVLEASDAKLVKERPVKPNTLEIGKPVMSSSIISPLKSVDNDKTPVASEKNITPITENPVSDSETEVTGQVLTETELSDWTADDAVSENFVDIEFVLNSNKGTIRRNKKGSKKKPSGPNSFSSSIFKANRLASLATSETPTKECGGILENLAIGEIDFMDTGSEGSCAEAYSATNRALIQNHGYIEFIENDAVTPTLTSPYHQDNKNSINKNNYHNSVTNVYKRSNSNKEIPGIDYIEQGACILGSNKTAQDFDLKTPVNETIVSIFGNGKPAKQHICGTDSTNEIDDDSLAMITSQGTTNTTTEESDCLTVVTSPLDSSSPRTQDNLGATSTTSTSGTPFEQLEKVMSVGGSSSNSSKPISGLHSAEQPNVKRKSSQEDSQNSNKRKDSEEISYEEYVRKLQQKITQISNARDSIDVKKHKRKTSRGESIGSGGDPMPAEKHLIENKTLDSFDAAATVQKSNNQPIFSNLNLLGAQAEPLKYTKVPEVSTLSSKLEEITKERTKQKDLIHDLVMDKLQSKKQLNAEKRLNRNRNRNMMNSNNSSTGSTNTTGNSLSLSSSKSITGTHSNSKAGEICADVGKENIDVKVSTSINDSKDITKVSTNLNNQQTNIRRQRPLSDNLEKTSFDLQVQNSANRLNLVSKKNSVESLIDSKTINTFPVAPATYTRKLDETPLTERLRADARARARLKSNQDLGISPEEKLKMLRKRYNLDMQDMLTNSQKIGIDAHHRTTDDDLKARHKKMTTSKSVNDINHHSMLIYNNTMNSDENFNLMSKKHTKSGSQLMLDFTSDPNLINSTTHCGKNCDNKVVTKLSKRHKDPERRKSLIQAVSNFFNKNSNSKKDKESQISPPKDFNSSCKDQSQSQNSIEQQGHQTSVFSRFRISPKSKDKSKSCFDIRNFGFGDKDETTSAAAAAAAAAIGVSDGSNLYRETYKKYEYSSTPQLFQKDNENYNEIGDEIDDEPPPIPPLPLNYQRSDDESYTNESREYKKQRALSKASRQAELKRIRIAQEIQREQEEIEVQLKEYEARGVLIEKALRGEGQNIDMLETTSMGATDEKLLKELLEIWRNITQLKKRDEELSIRQQELKLEHRHAQLKDELNMRLSCSKLDKSSADVAAEGAILNEMLEIVAKRAALRPNENSSSSLYASDIGNVVTNKTTTNNRQSTSNNNTSDM